jgi:hypothetical protein
LEGDSGEQPKMVSAGQGGELKDYCVRHPSTKKVKTFAFWQGIFLFSFDRFLAKYDLLELSSDRSFLANFHLKLQNLQTSRTGP